MLKNLYDELSKMDLTYHALCELEENKIFLTAKTLVPEGVEEAIRIKRLADIYRLCAIWDGQDIEIRRCAQ